MSFTPNSRSSFAQIHILVHDVIIHIINNDLVIAIIIFCTGMRQKK